VLNRSVGQTELFNDRRGVQAVISTMPLGVSQQHIMSVAGAPFACYPGKFQRWRHRIQFVRDRCFNQAAEGLLSIYEKVLPFKQTIDVISV
jgi:hypothetical protein